MATPPEPTHGCIKSLETLRDKDVRGYICDGKYVVKLNKTYSLDKCKDELESNIKQIFKRIKSLKGKEIKKFYIGKTYVQKTAGKPRLLYNDPETWVKDGIRDRWYDHNTEDHGKDGLIVIAIIKPDKVPNHIVVNKKVNWKDQKGKDQERLLSAHETYALRLEARLILHYTAEKPIVNSRCMNTGTDAGGYSQTEPDSSALYVTFTLEK